MTNYAKEDRKCVCGCRAVPKEEFCPACKAKMAARNKRIINSRKLKFTRAQLMEMREVVYGRDD